MKPLHWRLLLGSAMAAGLAGLLWADAAIDEFYKSASRQTDSPGFLFALLAATLIVAGSVELCHVVRTKGLAPLTATAAVLAAVTALSGFLIHLLGKITSLDVNVVASIGVVTLIVFLAQAIRSRTADAINTIAATLLPICYLGGLGWFIVNIRLEFATAGLLLFLAAVKSTDVGAYFVGSRIGRHKLIPWLSPGKSWEGLAGGVVAAVGVSLAIALPLNLLNWRQAVIFGIVMAVTGQLGDLAESLLKRDSGLKDSGHLIPAFGGILDVLDSLLGAAPFAYLLLTLMHA